MSPSDYTDVSGVLGKWKNEVVEIIDEIANETKQVIWQNPKTIFEVIVDYWRGENVKNKLDGWCLMNNHVHLLLKEEKEDVSITMKRIGVSFV